MAIPTLTETLDDEFTSTWYQVRAEAIDNILDATPITALLKMKGAFEPQSGGRLIERTIRYGQKTAFAFGQGDVLPVTEEQLETVAFWEWAYLGVPVTRTFVLDQQNAGPDKIKSYLDRRLTAARQAMVTKHETVFMAEVIHASGSKEPLSIFDYIPDNVTTADYMTSGYSYGGITRDNLWWQHADFTAADGRSTGHTNHVGVKAGPAQLTMLKDMTNAYNTCGRQLEYPDMILTTQAAFEIYQEFAVAKEQLVRDETTRLADLGYEVMRFMGKPITWSPSMTPGQMVMLNSNYFDVVYDPAVWFDMTPWESPERQLDRVAYIVSAIQNVGYNPRFNCRIKWNSI